MGYACTWSPKPLEPTSGGAGRVASERVHRHRALVFMVPVVLFFVLFFSNAFQKIAKKTVFSKGFYIICLDVF